MENFKFKKPRNFIELLTVVSFIGLEGDEGVPYNTGVRCLRRLKPYKKRCTGIIISIFDFDRETIEWECPVCRFSGILTHIFGIEKDIQENELFLIPENIHNTLH